MLARRIHPKYSIPLYSILMAVLAAGIILCSMLALVRLDPEVAQPTPPFDWQPPGPGHAWRTVQEVCSDQIGGYMLAMRSSRAIVAARARQLASRDGLYVTDAWRPTARSEAEADQVRPVPPVKAASPSGSVSHYAWLTAHQGRRSGDDSPMPGSPAISQLPWRAEAPVVSLAKDPGIGLACTGLGGLTLSALGDDAGIRMLTR